MIGVVGGSGFVGSTLTKLISERGGRLRCYDIATPNCEDVAFTELDVTQPDVYAPFRGCKTIINLAAEHKDNVRPISKYYDVNVQGAKNICQLARESGVNQIIFTSSVAVFGFAAPGTCEQGAVNPFNDYGKSKLEAEQVYRDWQLERPAERSLVIVRPTVIFGPGNRGNVYNLLSQIANRKFVMFGSGVNVKSMAFVDNVARFLVHCQNCSSGIHVYNYVDKPDLSMNELVQVARKVLFNKSGVGFRLPGFIGVVIGVGFDVLSWVLGKPLAISSIRVRKFMATTQFSSAVAETGFKAPFTLAEGLEKTLRYEFLEDNRDKPTYDTE